MSHFNRCRKSIWQNAACFIIKTHNKLSINEAYNHIIKATHKKPTANVILIMKG